MARARGTVVLVQARMGSQRLPGKVLEDLCGAPVLQWLLERIRPAERVDRIVVATTELTLDDPVVSLCEDLRIESFRGQPTDVLRRLRDAADHFGAETVVRISGDSPLLDHSVVDYVVEGFARGRAEIAENHTHGVWPVGTAVEAMSLETLHRLDVAAMDPRHREHVTLYAYENPDQFDTAYLPAPAAFAAPGLRIVVDTPSDLEHVRSLCERLAPRRDFGLEEVIQVSKESAL